jgi:UDP-N-acetylmuramate dehydrogenase
LREGGEPTLRYRDLLEEVDAASSPSLATTRDAVLAVRRRKSMVLDPADPDSRSAGSFFLNPVVDDAVADELQERVAREGIAPDMPRYEAEPGRTKLSAAWLLERAGLRKGHVHRGAGISSRHVLALVNRGGATAAEILELAIEVRRRVEQELGVRLVPEPNLVGFTPEEIAALRA